MNMSVAIVCMVNKTALKKFSISFGSNITQTMQENYENTCLFKQVPGSELFVRKKYLFNRDNCFKYSIY